MTASRTGFTLIELAIALVIIGLIIGGIMVGGDLVTAARTRAQISQFEQYNAAVNTFRSKYHAFAGDLIAAEAQSMGFASRAGTRGHGDGNGVLETCDTSNNSEYPLGCEILLFWSDLHHAGLIAESVPSAGDVYPTIMTLEEAQSFFPTSKVSDGTSIIVASDSRSSHWFVTIGLTLVNAGTMNFGLYPMLVHNAYGIDNKIDDGKPLTGGVILTVPGTLDPVTGTQTFIADYSLVMGPELCADNDEYNLTNPGGQSCFLAVKMPF
jgi:prepilin-type N-terminal cleavage/methylation domain-containing protein